eukprot:PhF_6_TR32363/c0_g1_i2/m.47995/K00111/glpA, glpD; glycerol-3-phosphate dehydrogenase
MSLDYDVLIIGGGVVGLALVKETVQRYPEASIVVIDQAPKLLSGASRGNSAMIHTGFDATPGTLEATLVKRGHSMFYDWAASRRRKGISTPYKRNGAIMAAWTAEEDTALNEVIAKANANGVTTQVLTARETYFREPCLADGVRRALSIPGETSIDPWVVPTLYLMEGKRNTKARVDTFTRCRAKSVTWNATNARWEVGTSSKGTLTGKVVFNAAGLRGDEVEKLRTSDVPFEVYPRAGRYLCYSQSSISVVSAMLLPIPTKQTKGIILFPTLYGHVIIGPTAEEPGETHVHAEVVERLKLVAEKRVPLLKHHTPTWEYAGSRPALVGKSDYFIRGQGPWIAIAGVRSTGLTASPSIAEYVYETYQKELVAALGSGKKAQDWVHVPVEDLRLLVGGEEGDAVISHPIGRYGWPKQSKL